MFDDICHVNLFISQGRHDKFLREEEETCGNKNEFIHKHVEHTSKHVNIVECNNEHVKRNRD